MIAIFDREPDSQCLRLADLLRAVLKHSDLQSDDKLSLTRMGGTGQNVWSLESRLDAGETVTTSIGEVLRILLSADQIIDELQCCRKDVAFGLMDATYLFIESHNKGLETAVASEFEEIKFLPD